MKKITKILLVMLTLMQTYNVLAQDVQWDVDNSSKSEKSNITGCPSGYGNSSFDNYSGCGGFLTSEFIVRVTLVTSSGNRVSGTKTIELHQNKTDNSSYSISPYQQYMSYVYNRSDNLIIGYYGINKSKQESEAGNLYNNISQVVENIKNNRYSSNSYKTLTSNTSFSSLNHQVNYFKGSSIFSGASASDVYVTNLFDSEYPEIETNFSDRYNSFLSCLGEGNKCEVKQLNSSSKTTLNNFILTQVGYINNYNMTASKAEQLKNRDYRLAIERVTAIQYASDNNGLKMVVGTSKQLASYLKNEINNRTLTGTMAQYKYTTIYNMGCQIYSSTIFTPKTIRNKGNCTYKTPSQAPKKYYNINGNLVEMEYNSNFNDYFAPPDLFSDIANTESIYGINYAILNPTTTPSEKTVTCTINVDTCTPASTNITATSNDDLDYEPLYYCIYDQEEFKENDTKYCVDQLSYDIPNVLNSELSNGTFNQFQYVAINGFSVKNTRICYSKSKTSSSSIVRDYKFEDITLRLFGRNYTYTAYDSKPQAGIESTIIGGYGSERIYKTIETYETHYNLKGTNIEGVNSRLLINVPGETTQTYYDSKLMINTNNFTKYLFLSSDFNQQSYTNYIKYYNNQLGNMYGTNGIMSKLRSGTYIKEPEEIEDIDDLDNPGIEPEIGDEITRIYQLEPGGTSSRVSSSLTNKNGSQACYFYNNIVKGTEYEDIKFRTISLSNPFPGQDGRTRIPGINWLNDYNNVYNYITNNRNIQETRTSTQVINPEMMYLNKTPLYTVTLNAANMIKIREYNKTHNYNDIKLDCKTYFGRECTSKFLRNTNYIQNLTGTCSNAVLSSTTRSQYDKIYRGIVDNINCQKVEQPNVDRTGNDMSYYCSYDTSWDLNGDRKIDQTDLLKAESYLTNKNYYSCADKTAASGG